MGATQLLKEVITLTSNVERLDKSLERLEVVLRDLNDRIVKLENSAELTVEMAKNASVQQSAEINGKILERLVRTEVEVASMKLGSNLSDNSGQGRLPGDVSGHTPNSSE